MVSRSFLKAGHLPTLPASFLYFDLSFMVWVLLGSLTAAIAEDIWLTPPQKGMVVALPVLAGASFAIALLGLIRVKARWRRTWPQFAGAAAPLRI